MSVKFGSLDWKPVVKKLDSDKGYFFGTIRKNVEPMIEGGKLISTAVKDKITYYLIEKPPEKIDTRLVVKAAKVKPVKEKKIKKAKAEKKPRISKRPAKAIKRKIKKRRKSKKRV